jgi:hypothetical protein
MEMEKIVDKVRKLLATAKGTTSEEEAQTSMLLAQKLLAKHGISMSDVDIEEQDSKNVVEENVTDPSGRTPWWKKQLAVVIADNFKCKTFIACGYKTTKIMFLGLEVDVAVAKDVFQYAETVIDKLAKSYVGKIYRQGKPTKGIRNEFIWGFITGLQDKFKEQVEKNNWGLVLVTDALVVQAYEDKGLRRASSGGIRPNFSGDAEARSEGYKHGQNFADNKKGIE